MGCSVGVGLHRWFGDPLQEFLKRGVSKSGCMFLILGLID